MNWQSKRIMVIGDIMVDRFVYGKSTRLSPDGPVPVVDYGGETTYLGGAANVARNIQTLGAESVLIGVVDKDVKDVEGVWVRSDPELGTNIGIMESVDRRTLVKERIFSSGQQVCRIDKGTIRPLDIDEEDYLLRIIYQEIKDVDAVIISDYGKGVITHSFMRRFSEYYTPYSHMTKRPLIIDPKPLNIPWYSNKIPTVIIPNRNELQDITNTSEVYLGAERVMRAVNAENVLVTCGEEGMFLLQKHDGSLSQTKIASATSMPKFVAGAGDIVAAVMALGLCSGHTVLETAKMANLAAAIGIEKEETSVCYIEDLMERWSR